LSLVNLIEKIVRNVVGKDPVHGWPHVKRVLEIARWIALKHPEADLEVIEMAALLHDISRNGYEVEDHAMQSAIIAKELLTALGYPKDKLQKVVSAIETHSYSSGRKPDTIEGMILSDADKLDALGAIGIARVFMYSGILGRSLEESVSHFKSKILKLPEKMMTNEGREEALRRLRIVENFIKELEFELRQS